MDVEIKFTIGNVAFDIDVRKDQIEHLKDLYKSLLRIEEITYENNKHIDMGLQSLDKAVSILQNSRTDDPKLADTYRELTNFNFTWLTSIHDKYHSKDFGAVFEKYINN